MFDYSEEDYFSIEHVDYEIHMFKIKLEHAPYLVIGVFALTIGPLLMSPLYAYGVGGTLIASSIAFSRFTFMQDELLKPFEYRKWLVKLAKRIKFFRTTLGSYKRIRAYSSGVYRG